MTAQLLISRACTACGACLITCPEHALLPDRFGPRLVAERCSSCGECIEVCPRGAITERVAPR